MHRNQKRIFWRREHLPKQTQFHTYVQDGADRKLAGLLVVFYYQML